MRINKDYKKLRIYVFDEDLKRLDNYFQSLPEDEIKDSITLLSEQRAFSAGAILSSTLSAYEEFKNLQGLNSPTDLKQGVRS